MSLQPNDKSCVWGVNSFAQFPLRGCEFSVAAAQQIRYRMPCLTGLDAALRSGLWIAGVDWESVATARGAFSGDGLEFTRSDGASAKGPRVMKRAATLR